MADAKTTAAPTLTDLLFDRSVDGLCLVSPNGSVVRTNAEWLRSTGFTEEQVLGENIVELFPDTRDMAIAMHARARAGHRVEVPRQAQTVNGRQTWWEGSIEPVPIEGGIGLLIRAREDTGRVRPLDAQRAEEALRRTEAVLQYAGAMAHLGAWWIDIADPGDLNANPLHWSDEVYRIFGYEPGGVAVSNWLFFEHVHPEDRQRVSDAVARARATRQPYAIDHRIVTRSGSERFVLEHGSFEFDDAGRPIRIVGAVQDVTDRRRAEDALRDADRRKDEFLAVLSHELRNPLAPLRSSSYILRHAPPGSEPAMRAQTVIERQMEHLTRLVDDLLDVTRIARGKIELRRSRVDLCEVVSRAADDFRVLMHDRSVRFDVAIPDEKLWADADATRITQVVGNLLHNASKFARKGDEVTLALETAGHEAVIRIGDTGAGIEPELLPLIFEAFVQGERTLARTEGGLGLGLALVKGIAELHGGSVRADSLGKGKGAVFTVRLPLLAVLDPDVSFAPRTNSRTRGRRVLVVDDSRDAAESLADLVRVLGHTAEVAYDGPTAIEKARANLPNVVLCDIGLPGMSGYEVAQAIRATAAESIRLIAVSGYAQPEDVKRAFEAGFEGHIAKPADPAEIEKLLG